MTDFSAMTDAIINRRVAEAMGHTLIEAGGEEWFDSIPAEQFPIAAVWPSGVVEIYSAQYELHSKTFRPATSIEDAWELVDLMVGRRAKVRVWSDTVGWGADVEGPDRTDPEITSDALTAPRAISDAYLAWHESRKEWGE